MKKELIIFTHIPKASGSTLVSIIDQEYGKKNVFKIRVNDTFEDIQNRLERRLCESDTSFFSTGHLGFGIHDFISVPVRYITMLREPVSLLISRYHYRKSHPKSDHPLVIHANNSTLESFAEDIEDNMMTRFLSGMELKSQLSLDKSKASFDNLQIERLLNKDFKDISCSKEMLEAAKKNLENSVDVFGITERFNESLILFRKELEWKKIHYVRRNTSRSRKKEKFFPQILESIRSRNHYDVELYNFSCELFEKRIRSYGSSFPKELKNFELLNPMYGRLNSMNTFFHETPRRILSMARDVKKKLF